MNDAVFDRFSNLTVLCIGDLMLDRFTYGDAARISPEAPIPVVRQSKVVQTLGGVGNAARNIQDLGAKAHIIAVTGVDNAASDIQEIMAEIGMDHSGIFADPTRKTSEKIRIIARQQQMLRLDIEDTHDIDDTMVKRVKAGVDAALANAQAVLISDYGKGLLTKTIIAYVIEKARALKLPILVDPKGADYTKYKGATLVTPNLSELSLATGGDALKSNEDVIAASNKLIKQCDLTAVIATRSKDGMSVIEAKGAITHLPTRAREVFDVSGAGDTVIAVMALCLAAGLDMHDAAFTANAAGGVVVGKLGTATLSCEELSRALASTGPLDDKIMTWEQAKKLVTEWHKQGLKVVTTNGAFDVLHEGHVTLLNQARACGDRLIVLLNSDASIQRYKDPRRPINPARARQLVMAALGCVDAVLMFGETADENDKPLKVIEYLQPDIHVKGGDYELEKLPETPVVRKHGGEMVIIPFVDGYSTSATLAKIQAAAS